MFRGLNAINLDAKGRLSVPARYRDMLQKNYANQLVVTIDTEAQCLLLYPMTEWEKIETKLQGLPSFNQAARRIQRLLIGHATELECDANGRVVVPPLLRDYAQLDKKVMLVGQGFKFEIWDEQLWAGSRERWLAEEAGNVDDLPEALQDISL